MSKFLTAFAVSAFAIVSITPVAACPVGYSGNPCRPNKSPRRYIADRKIQPGKMEQAPPPPSTCRTKGPNGKDIPIVPPPAGC